MGLQLGGVLFRRVEHRIDRLLAEEGVVVEVELGVDRDDPPLGVGRSRRRDDQRVDLDEAGVGLREEVGQLEEEELFYLLTRGLPEVLAKNLLTYGFAEEIINKIKKANEL